MPEVEGEECANQDQGEECGAPDRAAEEKRQGGQRGDQAEEQDEREEVSLFHAKDVKGPELLDVAGVQAEHEGGAGDVPVGGAEEDESGEGGSGKRGGGMEEKAGSGTGVRIVAETCEETEEFADAEEGDGVDGMVGF